MLIIGYARKRCSSGFMHNTWKIKNVKVLSSTSIQCVLHPGYNYRVETFQLPAMNGRRSAIESELMPEAWRTDAPVRSAGACVCTLKIKSTHRRMRESMVAFPHSPAPPSHTSAQIRLPALGSANMHVHASLVTHRETCEGRHHWRREQKRCNNLAHLCISIPHHVHTNMRDVHLSRHSSNTGPTQCVIGTKCVREAIAATEHLSLMLVPLACLLRALNTSKNP